MTKIEKALAALRAKGVNTTATKWETISAKLVENGLKPEDFQDDFVFSVDDDLLKIITNSGGKSFDSDELKAELKAEKEREYPDYGREIPEGTYYLTGYTTVIDWRNPRTDNISHIRVAFLDKINPKNGKPYMLPFAAFAKNQYPFVPVGDNSKFTPSCVLEHYDSVADRHAAVVALGTGFAVKVCHKRGHHDNPYNKRVFDFTYTWVERG